MVVSPDGEGAFEQRLLPITLHTYPRPSYSVPVAIFCLRPRGTFEHSMIGPVDRLCMLDVAIRIEILDVGVFGEYIMVWLKVQLYSLVSLVEAECDIEV